MCVRTSSGSHSAALGFQLLTEGMWLDCCENSLSCTVAKRICRARHWPETIRACLWGLLLGPSDVTRGEWNSPALRPACTCIWGFGSWPETWFAFHRTALSEVRPRQRGMGVNNGDAIVSWLQESTMELQTIALQSRHLAALGQGTNVGLSRSQHSPNSLLFYCEVGLLGLLVLALP
jgi:hypothetical protein